MVAVAILLVGWSIHVSPERGYEGGWIQSVNKEVEQSISDWKPTASDRAVPDPSLLVSEMNPEGQWAMKAHLAGCWLEIRRIKENKFAVRLDSIGCVGAWGLDRTATFANGTLTFDRPMKDYAFGVFDRLYAVKVKGVTRLVLPYWVASRSDKFMQERPLLGAFSRDKQSNNPEPLHPG